MPAQSGQRLLPSAAMLPNGTTYMIYKSRSGNGAPLQLGITRAPHRAGPNERISDEPAFQFGDPNLHAEDPYLWYDNGLFHVIMKDDFKGESIGITGEWDAGIYATSEDCLNWKIAESPKAYSRTVLWDDGTTTVQPNLERPNLLIQDDVLTHLFCATCPGPRPWNCEHSWAMCFPLRTADS
jgi:hypothetical protein